ncbi:NUDIX domain-containing protein [Paenibacillus wynnii]|nr:NUDIX hydrolase [Paenibacillus wynnii]
MKINWFTTYQIPDELVTFAVILAKYNKDYVIIKNRNRGGWEIPGGRREEGETIQQTACRELYEETGAVKFNTAPYGIYSYNDTYGMAFVAEVVEIEKLPDFEIEEIKFVEVLPRNLNFGILFHHLTEKLEEVKSKLDWQSVHMKN